MPTIMSHAAVPLAVGVGLGRRTIPPRLLLAGSAVAIIPDLDVAGFSFGVPYESPFGHRGFTHSLACAALRATVGTLLVRPRRASVAVASAFLFRAAVSPLSLDRFLSDRGAEVLESELRWVGLPCAVLAVAMATARRVGR